MYKTMYKKLTAYFLVAVFGAVVGSGITLGYNNGWLLRSQQKAIASLQGMLKPSTAQAQAELSANRDTAVVRAAEKVGPAVVGITNKAYAMDPFQGKTLVEQGVGSGVIFDSNGYIVTNNHVVAGAEQITVSLADGRVMQGKVLGADPVTDLAVVKVDATGLPTAQFGDSSTLRVGEPAIAIGNPLGLEFQGSVTAGVISALNRSIEIGERKFKLIQTDAAINPGNSGGALVNADGVVVGINSAKVSVPGVEGMGFAIPINMARPIIKELIAKGHIVRPYLGVGVMDNKSAAAYGYDLQLARGVYVAKVEADGPAGQAGILKGDIILSVAGQQTNTVADLRDVVDAQKVGEKVIVVVLRDGDEHKIHVVLKEMPSQQ
ncbi:peptidase s1c [Lucifera butyrica]|uniref:Peptidase s1c n=1 Tax=Lucifera butyrica TaxID=1351585 RepID=A0A498RAE0_9FIRM|nr:trypsin-like peptidase domain-containing protein [Lucifera butyrica]VBB08361.1 peptidase s1c [Lucifera butyrica]